MGGSYTLRAAYAGESTVLKVSGDLKEPVIMFGAIRNKFRIEMSKYHILFDFLSVFRNFLGTSIIFSIVKELEYSKTKKKLGTVVSYKTVSCLKWGLSVIFSILQKNGA